MVATNLPESLQVERLGLTTQLELNESGFETINYEDEVNIGSLEPGETKILLYDMIIVKDKPINFSVVIKNEQGEVSSNEWNDNVTDIKTDIELDMFHNTPSDYVKSGDIIEYTITVKNKTDSTIDDLSIIDSIPSALSINRISKDGENIEYSKGNNVVILISLGAKATTKIQIETVVDYSPEREEAEAITNIAHAELLGETIATTMEVNHIIQADIEKEEEEGNKPGESTDPGDNNEDPEENNGSGDNNQTDDNNIAQGNRIITGIAWYDENANGQRDQNEALLNQIKVRLLNTQTNQFVKDKEGNILEATTNENGIYILNNISKGKYIVIFDYDNSKYGITKYKAEGVIESRNSDAMINELLIQGEKQQVASTDIIEVQDENISGVNIGFVILRNFDLALDKYVSRLVIQNANGTTVREYNNETMAKVEIDSKQIKGSTVIIEYKIQVTNRGEIEGYAKKIVDYIPNDLQFNSELNKDWYKSGNALYNTSLANEKIKAGETKTIDLVLTKTMTDDNVGLIPNTAEIMEDYNELAIADSNSTPNNQVKEENDYGFAQVVISIRTGAVTYISIVSIIMIAIGIAIAIVIIKKKQNKEI